MQKNYMLVINVGNGMTTGHFIDCDFNLLEAYKRATIQKDGFIVWDKGVIDISRVIGVIDNTPEYAKE